jgi:hypothetical protein
MQSSLKPKPTDDPHDYVVIPPDAVRVAPSDDEISDLLRAAARQHSDGKARTEPDQAVDSAVPPLDATFRPTAVNDDFNPRRGRVMRAIATVLIAACIGAAAMAWQASGYAAKKLVAKWIPQFALTTSLPLDRLGFAAKPAAPADEPVAADDTTAAPAPSAQLAPAESSAAQATPAQATPAQATSVQATPVQATPVQSQPESAVSNAGGISAESAPSLQSMARDLANARQEVEALKASFAELKASQQQMARELAKASEQNAHARITPAPARPAVANARKPAPAYAPSPTASAPASRPAPSYAATQAAAPPVPQATQPYAPRQIEPLPPPQTESVPRPPMPVQ